VDQVFDVVGGREMAGGAILTHMVLPDLAFDIAICDIKFVNSFCA